MDVPVSQFKSLNPWVSCKHLNSCFYHKNVADLDNSAFKRVRLRKKYKIKLLLLENGSVHSGSRLVDPQLHCLACRKSRRMGYLLPFASADDSITMDSTQGTSSGIEDTRVKLDQLQNEDYNSALVQSLHDAARVFELAIIGQSSVSKLSWFSFFWLGVDQNAWVKALSYQASVYSLLLAACQISSRRSGKNRDINVFIQRSLSQLYGTLESVIKDAFSDNRPELYEWFCSEQVPIAVSTFVSYIEEGQQFAELAEINQGTSLSAVDTSRKSLPIFALTLFAAIIKLGPTTVSCMQFYSVLSDMSGRIMDKLVELIPIPKTYHSIKKIGLETEFLVHFGPRTAACRIKHDQGTEEVLFWVSLVQKQLQQAISRERIWSRLTSSETIEVLDKDLAIFGFFIALGRKTQQYLYANNFVAVPEPIEELIRHLIGGSVLYYPQLSAISSYQLYVEVVCEELDWLPFYPGVENLRPSHGHRSKQGPRNEEAITIALDVCLHWIQSFIKYSKWLENPSNVKAARFLSRGHNILQRSIEDSGLPKKLVIENSETNFVKIAGSRSYATPRKDLDSFDKALESVDEALLRLEELLQERDVSSSNSGKEQLKAACSDLEKIRKLKKEAEFLEASFRAKADSLWQGGDNDRNRGMNLRNSNIDMDRSSSKYGGFWSFFVRHPRPSLELYSATAHKSDNIPPEANEIRQFELIRNELKELERRAERSANRSNKEEEINTMDDPAKYSNDAKGMQVVRVKEKENIIEKSITRFKETTTDVLQGTQLLALDVAAATGLLIRVLTGDDELTEKQKQALRRTLTDLASVIPIGFLMLLPVTAVGHAAMLAAIQRYIPSLIPSTYGPERLDLLRQLKKVKEMDTMAVDPATPANEP